MTPPINLRAADAADARAVAALHAASWRSAYRGILADAYLDGPVAADRLAFWHGRLETTRPDEVTILAETGHALIGFSSFAVGHDRRWGSLVGNLHADPTRRGRGIGRLLLRETGARVALRAADRPLHLFCLERNVAARGFYDRLGGAVVERCDADEPDGGRHPVLRYAWPTPAALMRGCG